MSRTRLMENWSGAAWTRAFQDGGRSTPHCTVVGTFNLPSGEIPTVLRMSSNKLAATHRNARLRGASLLNRRFYIFFFFFIITSVQYVLITSFAPDNNTGEGKDSSRAQSGRGAKYRWRYFSFFGPHPTTLQDVLCSLFYCIFSLTHTIMVEVDCQLITKLIDWFSCSFCFTKHYSCTLHLKHGYVFKWAKRCLGYCDP